MASSKIALIVLITLFAATAAFAQNEQKEQAPPQNPASDGSQPNSPAPTSIPIRVGGNVASASLVHQVTPVYPPIAKVAHISGTVLLHALIAKDGTIEQLDVVSGPPLLLQSAMDAVRQWVYRPTLVNGEPVLVDTTISVVFSLDGKNPNNAEGFTSPSDVPAPPAELPPTPAVDHSQDPQKEATTPQTPASANSEPNSSMPKPRRIRVGGAVASANLIHQVTPVYPAAAKEQRVEGTVLLHAIIGKDGTMQNLMYVSGPPILMSSAMEAVKQWQYKPTLLMGEPVEVDTTISVVYRLGGSTLKDPEKSNLPPATPPAELPPAPAVLAELGPPYADSSDGMYKQFVTVLAAWKSGDEQKFKSFRDGFALPDPKAWLAQTFGADQGAALLPTYEQSLEKFNSHIAWVSGNWANAPDLAFGVEPSELPKPPAESGPEAALPIPIVAPRIENFRFRIAGGELGLNEWVFSFVYLDGAFRIVGGTLTFWDEALQRLRAPTSVAGIVSAATLIHQVTPVYPKDAKKKRISGTVLLRATIGHDGTVENLEYVSGPPELTPSAMEAVKKWRYKPTLLNGEPVKVDTTISVTYTLSNH